MKILWISILFGVIFLLVNSETESFITIARGVAKICQLKENGSETDLDSIIKMDFDSLSDNGNCMLACIFEFLGLMVYGMLEQSGLDKMLEEDNNSTIGLYQVLSAASICVDIIKSDRCDVAKLFTNCTMTELISERSQIYGFNFNNN